jgi:hypothetical protein
MDIGLGHYNKTRAALNDSLIGLPVLAPAAPRACGELWQGPADRMF